MRPIARAAPAREVDHPPLVVGKRSLMRTTHAPAGGEQVTSHPRAEGPVGVGGGQRVLVEALAARRPLAVVARARTRRRRPLRWSPARGHSARRERVGRAGRRREQPASASRRRARRERRTALTRSCARAACWWRPRCGSGRPASGWCRPCATRPLCFSSTSPCTIISSVVGANSDFTGTTPHHSASRR